MKMLWLCVSMNSPLACSNCAAGPHPLVLPANPVPTMEVIAHCKPLGGGSSVAAPAGHAAGQVQGCGAGLDGAQKKPAGHEPGDAEEVGEGVLVRVRVMEVLAEAVALGVPVPESVPVAVGVGVGDSVGLGVPGQVTRRM